MIITLKGANFANNNVNNLGDLCTITLKHKSLELKDKKYFIKKTEPVQNTVYISSNFFATQVRVVMNGEDITHNTSMIRLYEDSDNKNIYRIELNIASITGPIVIDVSGYQIQFDKRIYMNNAERLDQKYVTLHNTTNTFNKNWLLAGVSSYPDPSIKYLQVGNSDEYTAELNTNSQLYCRVNHLDKPVEFHKVFTATSFDLVWYLGSNVYLSKVTDGEGWISFYQLGEFETTINS